MKTEKGFVLVTGLMLLFLITLMMVTAMGMLTSELRFASGDKISKQIFMIAEAGTEEARARLSSGLIPDTDQSNPNWIRFIGELPKAQDKGFQTGNSNHTRYDTITVPSLNYVVKINHKINVSNQVLKWDGTSENTSTGNTIYVIESTGYNGSLSKNIRTEVTRGTSSLFNHAVFSNKITINGSGYTDSYDSRVQPWSQATKKNNGNMGTNSITNNSVLLNGSIAVHGKVEIGPGGNTADDTVVLTNGSVFIDGGIVNEPNPKDMTPKTDPGGGSYTNIPSVINGAGIITNVGVGSTSGNVLINGSNNVVNVPGGTWLLSGFTTNGSGNILNIMGNTVIRVTGNFLMNGNNNITIQPGASLTMYVEGNLTLNGSNSVGQSSKPEFCVIYGVSSADRNYTLNGSSTFNGVVYAPKAKITVNGSSDLFGSFISKEFLDNGTGKIHYDEALSQIQSGTGNGPFKILKWFDRG